MSVNSKENIYFESQDRTLESVGLRKKLEENIVPREAKLKEGKLRQSHAAISFPGSRDGIQRNP